MWSRWKWNLSKQHQQDFGDGYNYVTAIRNSEKLHVEQQKLRFKKYDEMIYIIIELENPVTGPWRSVGYWTMSGRASVSLTQFTF